MLASLLAAASSFRLCRFVGASSALLGVLLGASSAQQVSWVQSPVNGHWYAQVAVLAGPGEALAQQYGGHLATIRSAAENAWIAGTFAPSYSLIGLSGSYVPGVGLTAPAWSSGEPVGYLNFAPGQPSGSAGPARVAMYNPGTPGLWRLDQGVLTASALLEIASADCDADGIPDVVQIFANPALDLDGDGILNACDDCNANGIADGADIKAGFSLDCNGNGVPDECDLATLDCNANGLIDTCEIASNPALDLDHNGFLDRCQDAGTPFCFGDDTGMKCPCDPGQSGSPGHGCKNSTHEGAILRASGSISVAGDSLRLQVGNMRSPTTAVFIQATIKQNNGWGSLSGDGLRCVNAAGGTLIRLGWHWGQPGSSSFGAGVGSDPLISVRGLIPAIGGTRYYQVYYRDNTPYCTTAAFNFSNALEIVWTP